MYDAFSEDYDRFVNWRERLAVEMPFIERLLHDTQDKIGDSLRILDAACGTGMHAIALAQRGFAASGADFSPDMIERARANATAAKVRVRFEVAGFGKLAQNFGQGGFDALLCLGNSLPHLLTGAELSETLADFAACLRPGGLLLMQNRNFDAILSRRERWMEPQSHFEGEIQRVFLRFYDFDTDGLLTFNLITLRQEGSSPWTQQVTTTRLRPMKQANLVRGLEAGGFEDIACYGSMADTPFDSDSSGNLVIVARRSRREPGGSGSGRLHTRS
jgi:glycine/sarcosine N-methyltransferase